jgi:hypothetical protein
MTSQPADRICNTSTSTYAAVCPSKERTKHGACNQYPPLNRVGRGADGRKARAYLETIIIINININIDGTVQADSPTGETLSLT